MDFEDPQYAFLLKPIKDLLRNWEIDINTLLIEFMNETIQHGVAEVDFAKASLVIQGSVAVWSRKVEYLSKVCDEALDLVVLDEEEQQKKQRTSRGKSKKCDSQIINFAELTTSSSARKTIDDDDEEGARLMTSSLRKNFHLNMSGSRSSSLRGSKMNNSDGYHDTVINYYDSLINYVMMTSRQNGLLAIIQAKAEDVGSDSHLASDNNNQQQGSATNTADPADPTTFMELEFHDEGDDHHDDDDNDDDVDPMPVDEEHVVRHERDVTAAPSMRDVTMLLQHEARNRSKLSMDSRQQQLMLEQQRRNDEELTATDQRPPPYKIFELLDRDNGEVEGWKSRPVKCRKSCAINFNKRKQQQQTSQDDNNQKQLPMLIEALRELTGNGVTNQNKISRCSLYDYKRYDAKKKTRLRQIKAQNRQPKLKKRKALKRKASTKEDDGIEEGADAEVEQVIAECIDEVDQAAPDDRYDDDDYNNDDDCDNGVGEEFESHLDANTIIADGDIEASYERLQEYVDRCFREANDKVKRTDMERRVKEWEERIFPYLTSQSKMPSFDIGACSRTILGDLETLNDDGGGDGRRQCGEKFVKIDRVMKGDEGWSIARKFASLLQLANDENVELKNDEATLVQRINSLKIRLIDGRHKDKLSNF